MESGQAQTPKIEIRPLNLTVTDRISHLTDRDFVQHSGYRTVKTVLLCRRLQYRQ